MNFLEINAPAEGRFEHLFDLAAESGTVEEWSGSSEEDECPHNGENHRPYMPAPRPEFTDERRVKQDR